MVRTRHSRGPGAPHLAANVAELRALAHPLRLRIMELFAEGPKTTKHVADLLGQPPTRLYDHVAALERAGLLHLKETRKNRGTVEKWYETTARRMGSTTPTPKTGRHRASDSAAKRAVAMTILEQSRQEVVAAMAEPGQRPLLARLVMVGPPKRLADLRQRLCAMVEDLQHEFACEEHDVTSSEPDRWAMTMTFAPIGRSRR